MFNYVSINQVIKKLNVYIVYIIEIRWKVQVILVKCVFSAGETKRTIQQKQI